MKSFEEIKAYIVDNATSKNACLSELNRAKNAKTIDDLLVIIKENIRWVSGHNLFTGQTIEQFFSKKKLIEFNLANTGEGNCGFSNTGNRNTGDWNTGNRNTGYSNTGNRNTGYSNTGDSNTGNCNTGNWNTGNWNTGNWNTGYSNTGDSNTGAFCTGEKYMKLFNKDSDWTERQWLYSVAYSLMCQSVDTKMWVFEGQMTDEDKIKYPSYKTTGGYLKDIPFKEAFQNAWHNWNDKNRAVFTSLPNFDAEIFESITGVNGIVVKS